MTLNPGGTLAYISNFGGTNVNVINVATNTIINSIGVGSAPVSTVFTLNGTFAFISNIGSSTVSKVTSINTVVNTIPVGTSPGYIGLNPIGTLLYVPNGGFGNCISNQRADKHGDRYNFRGCNKPSRCSIQTHQVQ